MSEATVLLPPGLTLEPLDTAGRQSLRHSTGRRRRPVARALFPGLLIALARAGTTALIGLILCAAVPVLFGWRSGVVLTGSMSPAFRVGDIVLSQPASSTPRPGRVIAVRDPVRPGQMLVHRLVGVDTNGDLLTKGDANQVADSSPVPRSGLIGVVRVRIPRLGLVAVWARDREFGRLSLLTGMVLALGLLATGSRQPLRSGSGSGPAGSGSAPGRRSVLIRHARRPGRPRRRRRPTGLNLGLSLAACLGLSAGTALGIGPSGLPGTVWSAFTGSTINSGNTFAALAVFPAYRHAVLADSPLAFYRGDEAAGATAAVDTSSHGSTGGYAGATGTFQVPGSPAGGGDAAVQFPGAGRGSAASNASLNTPNTFTSEAWFKTTSTAGGRFLGLGDATSGDSFFTDRILRIFGNGTVEFSAGAGSIDSTPGYNDGAWHLATGSLGPAGMRLYVDGALKATNPAVTTGQNYTGYWRLGGDNVYYEGSLDEAAIYLSQLSDARVAAHYAAGLAATTLADYTTAVGADTPWALWHLDEPANASYPGGVFDTVMVDSSGQNHPGVYHNLPPFGLLAGGTGALVGTGAGGTSVHYYQSGTGYYPTAIVGPTAFSTELWFRSSSTTGGELIGFGTSRTGGSSGYDRMIYLRNDGRLSFGIYHGGPVVITSAGAYNNGAWHHVVATAGAAGLVLYVDGAQVAANAAPGSLSGGVGYWRWGGDSLGGWPNRPTSDYFSGDLDEIAVYPTELTAARVAAHYAANI